MDAIYDYVYSGVVDPPQPSTLHTIIAQMNHVLAPLGQRIRADKRGWGATYSLHKDPT